ncbi:MAG: arginase family protein [Bacteroidota bacterium]
MYNPSEAGKKGTIFGLPHSLKEADLVFLPIHLDATVSSADGTAKSPSLILSESSQLDLSLISIENPWQLKMAMHPKIVAKSQNEIHRGRAKNVIKAFELGKKVDQEQLHFVNEFCQKVVIEVERVSKLLLESEKIVAVVGGDHSSPLGLMYALASKYEFGILQIDAHMDLRDAYEGFLYSHASIMFNALKNDHIIHLTQVGVRDFCEEEERLVERSQNRIDVFFDENIFSQKQKEVNWKKHCKAIVETLPDLVYISFDIDGLEPSLCPHTGTPVPGGLTFHEAVYLIDQVARSGKKIIGFDVCETGNYSWDARVASRILFRLAACTGVSNRLLRFK